MTKLQQAIDAHQINDFQTAKKLYAEVLKTEPGHIQVEIEGVKYALLICFELRFKELWKLVEGADVVLIPSRWGKLRKMHLEVLSRALAVMNQCYVIVSNSSDEDMASSASIISPAGHVTMDDKQEAVEGTIDFREIKKMRRYIVMD